MITREKVKIKRRKEDDDFIPTEVKSVFPKRRQDLLNTNGWGFADSVFLYKKDQLIFTGNR